MHFLIIDSPTLSATFAAAEEHFLAKGHTVSVRQPGDVVADPGLLSTPDILVTGGGFPLDAARLTAARNVRAIVCGAIGTEGVDIDAASSRAIAVAYAPTEENVRSMAEAAILLMLSLLYDIDRSVDMLRYNRPRPSNVAARMLTGRTVGLIGFGRIARAVAGCLLPWGVNILVYTRGQLDSSELPSRARHVSLEELLRASDIVSLHASARAGDRPIIGSRELALMKRSAFLINTARGSLVDETALAEALLEQRIAGAALDTFVVEPLAPDHVLRTIENVILTPHMVGHTVEMMESLSRALIENLESIIAGRLPKHLKNPDVSARWLQRWGEGDIGTRRADESVLELPVSTATGRE